MIINNRFEILKGYENNYVTIGFGSYGQVKLAKDIQSGKVVAVKVVIPILILDKQNRKKWNNDAKGSLPPKDHKTLRRAHRQRKGNHIHGPRICGRWHAIWKDQDVDHLKTIFEEIFQRCLWGHLLPAF